VGHALLGSAGGKLRIQIVVQVEVDRQAYNDEYGERATAEDIRAHVKGEVVSAAESAFQNIDSVCVKGGR